MELRDLVAELVDIKDRIKGLEDDVKAAKEEKENIEADIQTLMLDEGMTSMKYPGLASVSLSIRSFPRIIDEEKFFSYLKSINEEGLIKQTVNTNSLASWFKEKQLADESLEEIGLSNYKQPRIHIGVSK